MLFPVRHSTQKNDFQGRFRFPRRATRIGSRGWTIFMFIKKSSGIFSLTKLSRSPEDRGFPQYRPAYHFYLNLFPNIRWLSDPCSMHYKLRWEVFSWRIRKTILFGFSTNDPPTKQYSLEKLILICNCLSILFLTFIRQVHLDKCLEPPWPTGIIKSANIPCLSGHG